MTTTWEVAATAAAALGAGVTGGVYFAFSTMVLPTLGSLPAPMAVTAMQRINVRAVRLPFMLVFLGGAAAAVVVVVAELASGAVVEDGPTRLGGALLALAAVGITIVGNVPLNDKLATVMPDAPSVADTWRSFCRGWSAANHARAVAAIAGAALLAASLARG